MREPCCLAHDGPCVLALPPRQTQLLVSLSATKGQGACRRGKRARPGICTLLSHCPSTYSCVARRALCSCLCLFHALRPSHPTDRGVSSASAPSFFHPLDHCTPTKSHGRPRKRPGHDVTSVSTCVSCASDVRVSSVVLFFRNNAHHRPEPNTHYARPTKCGKSIALPELLLYR